MKNKSIQRLKDLYMVEHYRSLPSIPQNCRFAPSYSDKTANGLTKCVITFLKLLGWQAERISNTGRVIDGTKTYTDCLGFKRSIGSVSYIKGSGTRGTADISSTIAGKSVKIEIKIGKDRQSEAQKEYERQITAAGGVYIIVRTFDEFLTWYDKFIEEVCHGN